MASFMEYEGQHVLRQLYAEPTVAIAVDTETTGLRIWDGRDWCIGVSIAAVLESGEAVKAYFATDHWVGENISDLTFRMLKRVLEQQGRPLVYANVQFDVQSLATVGIDVWGQEFYDILTMAHLIDENKPVGGKSLEKLGKLYLGEDAKIVDDKFINSEKKTGWMNTTPERMWEYAVVDAVTTWRVWEKLMLHREWLRLPDDIWPSKADLIRVLIVMKRRGVVVNKEVAAREEAIGTAEMARLREEMGINPGSNKQLAHLLIDVLGLPVLKTSEKTGDPSFDKTVMPDYELMLERMERKEAVILKQYRGWQKAVTASYRPYLALCSPDGRLRCSFTTHVTRTGRLSSVEPNLQQISKDGGQPWNAHVKESFEAAPGYRLVSFDYSQLELRLGTAYCDEQALKKVFREGRDIFSEMAQMLGMTRPDTKTMTYSLQYGAGEQRIMSAFGVSRAKARELIDNYWNTYPKFGTLNQLMMNKAADTKEIKIWTGRYRHFQYKNENYKALNSLIQGGAADIVERVMVRVFEELDDEEECRMLLQVHDALVFEIKEELVDEYVPVIQALMEDVQGIVPARINIDFDTVFAVEASDWSKAA